jgi:stage II sporulation protein D
VRDENITLAADGTGSSRCDGEYLPAALAGEMPAAFHIEALKAQAVALRTYALHYRAARKAAHPDADVCTSAACCAACADEDGLRALWGGDYERCAEKVRAAVSATDGQYLVWEDRPILAVFHAASGGMTESGSALGVAAPYLRSVSSPETAETVARLESTVEVAPEELRSAILTVAPAAAFGPDPAGWLGAVSRTESGRVSAVQIGGEHVSGLALRQLFALRSTDFTLGGREHVCFAYADTVTATA